MPTHFYHYSTQPLSVLKTKAAQGIISPMEREEGLAAAKFRSDPAPYYDHISFFTAQIPYKIIGGLFSKVKHEVWVTGKTVYEHVVVLEDNLTAETKDNIPYQFVETWLDKEFMEKYWPADRELSDSEKKKYFKERNDLKKKQWLIGNQLAHLRGSYRRYMSADALRDEFIKATSIDTDEELMKYAANVTHVMLYPPGGVLKLAHPPKALVLGAASASAKLPSWMKW